MNTWAEEKGRKKEAEKERERERKSERERESAFSSLLANPCNGSLTFKIYYNLKNLDFRIWNSSFTYLFRPNALNLYLVYTLHIVNSKRINGIYLNLNLNLKLVENQEKS